MSFDLVVWALDRTGEPADVTAGHKRCVAGIHAAGAPDRRINAFYADLTADIRIGARPATPPRSSRSRCMWRVTMWR